MKNEGLLFHNVKDIFIIDLYFMKGPTCVKGLNTPKNNEKTSNFFWYLRKKPIIK